MLGNYITAAVIAKNIYYWAFKYIENLVALKGNSQYKLVNFAKFSQESDSVIEIRSGIFRNILFFIVKLSNFDIFLL